VSASANSYRAGIAMKLGAERKAARRKCLKALAPILDIIRKHAVHASLKAVGASRNAPHNAPPSLSNLEASRAVLGLAAAARGAPGRLRPLRTAPLASRFRYLSPETELTDAWY
jgi:hypothetical protein